MDISKLPVREQQAIKEALESLDDLNVDIHGSKPLKVCLYGNMGCGKTHLATHFAKKGSLIVTAEHGAHSLAGSKFVGPAPFKVVQYVSLDKVLNYIKGIHYGVGELSEFDTVVIDTVTSVSDNIKGYSLKTKKFNRKDPLIPSLEDYQAVESVWRDFFTEVRNGFYDVNLVMTAHLRGLNEKEIDAGNLIGPDLTRAALLQVTKDCDFVGKMQTNEKGGREIVIAENNKFLAKNRASLPKVMRESEFITEVHKWYESPTTDQ